MSQFSVAIACHDRRVAERLQHCLEFIGIDPVLRAHDQTGDEPVIITDTDLPADGQVVIRIGCTAQPAPGEGPTLAWPPRQHDLVATLTAVRSGLAREAGASDARFPGLVGDSDPIRQIKRLMGQVAESDATVLLTGESGTGKDVVARGLHQASARRGAPFVPVNCGAIPGELLESELFGHEKGAFTGALDTKKGRFELANHGTLFLDEIGDLPLPMQVKLLRAIQDKRIERIGSARSVPCDVRIIAATNQDLERLIAEGRFREDLYYRLAVFPIALPPLRDRAGDVEAIVRHRLAQIERERDVTVTLSADAWAALARYDWPGNVRELSNLVERLTVQYPNGVVDVADLPLRLRSAGASLDAGPALQPDLPRGDDGERGVVLPVNGIDLRAYLADMERSLIKQALDDTESVVARAADRLHIRRTTLVEKMRKYGITREAV